MLFAFRLSVFLWSASVVIGLVCRAKPSRRLPQLVYYTNWNYLLQLVWWGSASLISGCALLDSEAPRRLRLVASVIFSIALPAALLVTAVLWGVLFPYDYSHGNAREELNFDSYNEHAINTVLLLLEFGSNRLLIRDDSIGWLFIWLLSYSAFAIAAHPWLPGDGKWPYFFMAMNTWLALMWYSVLSLLHLIAFGLAHGLSRLKTCLRPSGLEMSTSPQVASIHASDALLLHQTLQP
jgi:hypothetical protein